MRTIFSTYSGTPPYGHFGNTVTSLLGPLFLAARQNDHSFSLKKKTLVNTVTSLIQPNVFGPLVTVLTGFRTNIFAIASCYQISKVPSRNFGGRQFFVRHENPLFIDSCPSSGHSPKKLPSIDLSGHTKFTRRSQTLSCVFHLGQCNSSNFGKFSWS